MPAPPAPSPALLLDPCRGEIPPERATVLRDAVLAHPDHQTSAALLAGLAREELWFLYNTVYRDVLEAGGRHALDRACDLRAAVEAAEIAHVLRSPTAVWSAFLGTTASAQQNEGRLWDAQGEQQADPWAQGAAWGPYAPLARRAARTRVAAAELPGLLDALGGHVGLTLAARLQTAWAPGLVAELLARVPDYAGPHPLTVLRALDANPSVPDAAWSAAEHWCLDNLAGGYDLLEPLLHSVRPRAPAVQARLRALFFAAPSEDVLRSEAGRPLCVPSSGAHRALLEVPSVRHDAQLVAALDAGAPLLVTTVLQVPGWYDRLRGLRLDPVWATPDADDSALAAELAGTLQLLDARHLHALNAEHWHELLDWCARAPGTLGAGLQRLLLDHLQVEHTRAWPTALRARLLHVGSRELRLHVLSTLRHVPPPPGPSAEPASTEPASTEPASTEPRRGPPRRAGP